MPLNAEQNNWLFNFTNNHKAKCRRTYGDIAWLGIIANEDENYYQNYISGEKIKYENIRNDLILDWKIKKCLTFFGSDVELPKWHGVWNPVQCSYTTCPLCHFLNRHRFLTLRGLCQKSVFDRLYFIMSTNLTNYFKGMFYSFIKYFPYKNKTNIYVGYWKIFRIDKPHASAILKVKTESQYPTGKKL